MIATYILLSVIASWLPLWVLARRRVASAWTSYYDDDAVWSAEEVAILSRPAPSVNRIVQSRPAIFIGRDALIPPGYGDPGEFQWRDVTNDR